MSQYIQFFIKHDNHFAPIASYGSSSHIGELFNHCAPWEKVKPLSAAKIRDVIEDAKEKRDRLNKQAAKAMARKADIAKFNNPVDEKVEALYDVDDELSNIEETTEGLNHAIAFARFLLTVTEEAEDYAYNGIEGYDRDEYVYVGKECGYEPEEEQGVK